MKSSRLYFGVAFLLAAIFMAHVGAAYAQPPVGNWNTPACPPGSTNAVSIRELPPEAAQTLALIKQGGPFPYRRDGIVFGNRERRLPLKERGYYREFTVKTPGSRNRGARRIISGAAGEFYYTGDHYNSFKMIGE